MTHVTEPQTGDEPPAASEAEPPPTSAQTEEPFEGATLLSSPSDPALGAVPPPVGYAAPSLGLAGSLIFAALFSALSASLLRTLPSTLDNGRHDLETSLELRRHLGTELERAETLAASASLAAFVFRAAAIACLYAIIQELSGFGWVGTGAVTSIVGGLALHLVTQSVPLAIAQTRTDGLLTHALPALAFALRPFSVLVLALTAIRRPLLRVMRTPDADYGTRRLVEGFRAMVEESAYDGDLADGTREMLANVIDFSAADAAEVMTPRTEISAIAREETLETAIAVFAEAGYSRIPVYAETIDSVIGTLTALEAAKAVAEGRLGTTQIVEVMRPPLLVPETKLVAELLSDFREQRQKMAIVVDEYGGTAGLVTLADVMAEILGTVDDEFTEEDRGFVPTDRGTVDVDASLHVAEVNEELHLEIQEEADYETLGGFMLSEFGRFPLVGEAREVDGVHYLVTEASDRRILRVEIDPNGGAAAEKTRSAKKAGAEQARAAGAGPRGLERPAQGPGGSVGLGPRRNGQNHNQAS